MAKVAKSAEPTITRDLIPERTSCPHCGGLLHTVYANRRTLHTLAGVRTSMSNANGAVELRVEHLHAAKQFLPRVHRANLAR